MNNKIIMDRYIMYGLNRRRSFLPKATKPVELYTEEDVKKWTKEQLMKTPCECALFFVHLDGTYSAYFKLVFEELCDQDDLDEPVVLNDLDFKITVKFNKSGRGKDSHMFAWLDGEYRFCCYSLLLEVEDGRYEICT